MNLIYFKLNLNEFMHFTFYHFWCVFNKEW